MTEDKKPKKPFKETKVGHFLSTTGSDILKVIGEILPDQGWMGVVKNLIEVDEKLTESERQTALQLLKLDIEEMQAVTKRWEADMHSDNWSSKNVRPLSLAFLTIMTVALIWVESAVSGFVVDDAWIDLLKTLLITVYFAYFGSRGYEKAQVIVGKYKQKL